MRRKVLAVALAAACAGCVALPGSASAGTLDQQQLNGSGSTLNVDSTQSLAQAFTAGLTGGIDQVDLKLAGTGTGPTHPLTVQVRNAVGGSPGATVLASGSIPATAAPPAGSPAFVSLAFATPAPVQAGTQYAIVAFGSDVLPHRWGWAEDPTNPYASGSALFQPASPPGSTWTNLPTEDMAFKTYVLTPTQPTGRQAASLKKCKKKRSKAKRRKCRKKAKKLPV